jgi:hypothetical protein
VTHEEKYKLQQEKDTERVIHTIGFLTSYWLQRPYLRLGQLVSNAWHTLPEYTKNPEPEIADIYYLPDDRLVEGLLKLEDLERESTSKRTT